MSKFRNRRSNPHPEKSLKNQLVVYAAQRHRCSQVSHSKYIARSGHERSYTLGTILAMLSVPNESESKSKSNIRVGRIDVAMMENLALESDPCVSFKLTNKDFSRERVWEAYIGRRDQTYRMKGLAASAPSRNTA